MNIHTLPNEIVDKILLEFCGFAGYRWSKTGEFFAWRTFDTNVDRNRWRCLFENLRYKMIFRKNHQIIVPKRKEKNWTHCFAWHPTKYKDKYLRFTYTYEADTNTLKFLYEKRKCISPSKKNMRVEYIIK